MPAADVITPKLLERDDFRKAVFLRDKHTCVICKAPAVDAHHILERRLFSDGGYYLNNGASLCSDCHLKAEMTTISVEDIRAACGISENSKVLPEHLYDDQPYDKWGNPILPNGRRMRGELFDDSSVQKILNEANVLSLFSKYVKYPRTWHLPWSPGATKDDRIIKTTDQFKGQEVVVTIKMDGENTTMYNDYIHARSLSDKKHWSKSWIKNFHGSIAHDIPEDMRLVVENLYAKHSIKYIELESYCYGISAWMNMTCLEWDTSCEWFALLGIPVVPVLYRGEWDEEKISSIFVDYDLNEGYVVRLVRSFHYKDFSKSVAKFVRKGHVTSDDHWFYGKAGEVNSLKESKNV
jgi:hypothetical protein